ncbi:hypothetical protein JW960_10455 [candidate division KSB1 bacterium]|nr:hypothetical protein [candidate division KSB1 bacterium]
MSRFLIEVEHDKDELACAQVVHIFLSTGSHFLSNADWGCHDGEHKAWLVVDTDTKEQARSILPSAFRNTAKIVQLEKFTLKDVDKVLRRHERAVAV